MFNKKKSTDLKGPWTNRAVREMTNIVDKYKVKICSNEQEIQDTYTMFAKEIAETIYDDTKSTTRNSWFEEMMTAPFSSYTTYTINGKNIDKSFEKMKKELSELNEKLDGLSDYDSFIDDLSKLKEKAESLREKK
jgi:hypothetical protein